MKHPNFLDIIDSADEYELTNINGLLNVAIENPSLFESLCKFIQDSETKRLDIVHLSICCAERIEELGI